MKCHVRISGVHKTQNKHSPLTKAQSQNHNQRLSSAQKNDTKSQKKN